MPRCPSPHHLWRIVMDKLTENDFPDTHYVFKHGDYFEHDEQVIEPSAENMGILVDKVNELIDRINAMESSNG